MQQIARRQSAAQSGPARSPAQLNSAGTNPSSPPQNHCTANKARRQYITGMWQALAIMTLRSPLGAAAKVWAHDTLAYRGSNTWKYISGLDRGEDGEMMEWAALILFIRKEGRNGLRCDHFLRFSFQYGFSQIQQNLKWAWGPNPDSSLSKQATFNAIRCIDATILSYLALMQLSWYCSLVWTLDVLDTALPIIRVLCGAKAGQQRWNRTDKYSTTSHCSLPSYYLVADIENNPPVNPSPSLQLHTLTLQNTPNLKHKHSQCIWDVEERATDLHGDRSWLHSQWNDRKPQSDVAWKGSESEQPYRSVHGEWVVREIRPGCHMPGWHVLKVNCPNCTANCAVIQIFAFKLKVYPLAACWEICISCVVTKVSWNPISPHGRQFGNKNSFDIS